ncbi:MAG: glycosyltransferase family 2 protein, partial [Nitrospirae bacterium]|nr:glycosyltransferase family 2 protein [Nitrospirota bacterium]
MATGEYVGFLDHDDELSLDALYEVVSLLNRGPEADFIFSDKDKVNEQGERYEPHFKPDWSPDTFRGNNYLCHFTVIRKSLLDEVGGFRPGYEGSQDYDLYLRVTENARSIEHIPKILYHWRSVETSAAGDLANAKPYAFESAKKALRDHLERMGLKGEVEDGNYIGVYRVRYMIEGTPLVSIIIPTRDNVEVLKKCVESILAKSTYGNYELLVVDNQSAEEVTLSYFRELEAGGRVRIVPYDQSFNYSALNNYAVTQARGEYLVFLNNDTEVITPGWIEAMLEFAKRRDVGAVGALLYYPDDTVQHAGVIIGICGVAEHVFRGLPRNKDGYFGRTKIIQNLSAVTAACLMMRKGVFEEIGGFDAGFSHAYNDIDLCLRTRDMGYVVVYTPYAELYHHESMSRDYETSPEKTIRFCKEEKLFFEKWREFIKKGDPYYNPNLTLFKRDFSMKNIYEMFGEEQMNSLIRHSLWEKDTEIHRLNSSLWEKDTEIHRLNSSLWEKDAEIHRLHSSLWEKDAEIHRLNMELWQGKVSGKEKDIHIARLHDMIDKKDALIDRYLWKGGLSEC